MNDMIRTIITPDRQHISLRIPEEFVGKEVEVIAFPIDEASVSDDLVTQLASRRALSTDWLTPEEDLAWKDL